MIQKQYLLIIFALIILSIILSIYILNNRNNFEDTRATTFDMSKVNTTPANPPQPCTNGTDIPSVCLNFESCCSSSNNTNFNGECYCIHPFVRDCNDKYKNCLATNSSNTSQCSSILKDCCKQYSSNNILTSNFQKPIKATQMSNKLCSVNGLLNLEQRCMELCQTNPNCQAYSTTTGNCTLYDKPNYITSSDPSTIYVLKK